MSEPKILELSPESAAELLRRARANELLESDCEIIAAMIGTIAILGQCFENGRLYVKRLLKMIFGVKTEKKKNAFGKRNRKKEQEATEDGGPDANPRDGEQKPESQAVDPEKGKKAKGHGRNGAGDFSGAEERHVSNDELKPGDACPLCEKGKVYSFPRPGVVVRFFGRPLVTAQVWKLEKLRCNLCGAVFAPEPPKEAQGEKYDETAVAAIALAKYGFGMPFNRLQNFQACLGIPVPASTQWDKVEAGADKIYPAFEEMKRQAAQGRIVYNDDTVAKILELMKENEEGRNPDSRKGMFTTGIVSAASPATIALFFTGRGHAGENIADVLEKRDPLLPPPIQMCDALSRNFSGCGKVVLAHCNAHSRRNFFDVADNFPDQCEYVLTVFQKIYKNDALCKREGMDDMRRLEFHREKSGPILEEFQILARLPVPDEKGRTELRAGQGDFVRPRTLGEADPFSDRPRSPPGQQRLRTDSEKGDTQQEKRLVLQDPARSLRRRHVHESDPHMRHEQDKSLRLPDLPSNPFVRGV